MIVSELKELLEGVSDNAKVVISDKLDDNTWSQVWGTDEIISRADGDISTFFLLRRDEIE